MCPKSRKKSLIKAIRLVSGYNKRIARTSTRKFSTHKVKYRLRFGRTKHTESIKGKRVVVFVSYRAPYEQYYAPRAITISTRGLTRDQIALFKELERKREIPPITWIVSFPNSVDDKIRLALIYLHSEDAKILKCQMQKGYDYAWIKMALDHGIIPSQYLHLKSMSTPRFVEYIESLGFTDIAGSKTLNKFIAKATWLSEANIISFRGFPVPKPECDRRNNIALKFLEIVNEI